MVKQAEGAMCSRTSSNDVNNLWLYFKEKQEERTNFTESRNELFPWKKRILGLFIY